MIFCLLEISKLLICRATNMGILRLPGGRSLEYFGLESFVNSGGFSTPAGGLGDGSKFRGTPPPAGGYGRYVNGYCYYVLILLRLLNFLY